MNSRTTEVIDYIPLAGITFNELFALCYWFVDTKDLHAELGNMKAKGQAHKRRNGKWYPGSDVDELVSNILDRAQAGIAEPALEPTGK